MVKYTNGRRHRAMFCRIVCGIAVTLLVIVLAVAGGCGSSGSSTSGSASPSATVAGVVVGLDPALRAMLPSDIIKAGKVRVACDVPYPPWEMFASAGSKEITGADYDLAQAIGAKLGVPFDFQVTVFASVMPTLQSEKADVVISGMFDTTERQKVLDYVDYAKDMTVLVVEKGNPEGITDVNSLAGKTVAAQTGSVMQQFAQKISGDLKAQGKAPIKILLLPKTSDVELALKTGRAAAALSDGPTLAYTIQTASSTFELAQDPANPDGYNPSLLGMGVLKSNTQLRDAIQAALQALMDEGTYGKILAKYGLEHAAVKTATLNAG